MKIFNDKLMKCSIFEDSEKQIITSETWNQVYYFVDGRTFSCGRTVHDDPEGPCPAGPCLADIEISSAAEQDVNSALPLNIITEGGCSGKSCKQFCYKQATYNKTVHMSLDMLKKILDKFTKSLTQVAYGVCSIDSHPQLFEILEETHKRRITPNLTLNSHGVTDEIAEKLSKLCGAIAVSVNPGNKEEAYDCIKKLSQDYGMRQINIHTVVSEESASFAKLICDDMLYDTRLSKCNCVVLLGFKNKTGTNMFSPVAQTTYTDLINYYLDKRVPVGADSCSGAAFKQAIKNRKNAKILEQCITSCESLHESFYVNVFGYAYACSFCEGVDDWKEGVDLLKCNSVMDIWGSAKVSEWRNRMKCRQFECPYYKIGV